jgi:hypothetical protein
VASGDIDGDGFGDIVIGKLFEAAYLYLGGDAWSATPAVTLASQVMRESFGDPVSIVGDMNGDGLGELLVAASNPRSTPDTTGAVYLYLGRTPLGTRPDLTFHGPRDGDFLGNTLAVLRRSSRPRLAGW